MKTKGISRECYNALSQIEQDFLDFESKKQNEIFKTHFEKDLGEVDGFGKSKPNARFHTADLDEVVNLQKVDTFNFDEKMKEDYPSFVKTQHEKLAFLADFRNKREFAGQILNNFDEFANLVGLSNEEEKENMREGLQDFYDKSGPAAEQLKARIVRDNAKFLLDAEATKTDAPLAITDGEKGIEFEAKNLDLSDVEKERKAFLSDKIAAYTIDYLHAKDIEKNTGNVEFGEAVSDPEGHKQAIAEEEKEEFEKEMDDMMFGSSNEFGFANEIEDEPSVSKDEPSVSKDEPSVSQEVPATEEKPPAREEIGIEDMQDPVPQRQVSPWKSTLTDIINSIAAFGKTVMKALNLHRFLPPDPAAEKIDVVDLSQQQPDKKNEKKM
ncbi:MAG: hypothetical protein FWD19_06260 [Defluviitaleaceae bacterium]|nr:hypothetical protein [Defluviitaleaceae bacterium]